MLVTVIFQWVDQYGPCYECGRPAAFFVGKDDGPRPQTKRCAVCAANAAADGEFVQRIEPQD